MNEIITITEVNTTHWDYTTELTIKEVREAVRNTKKTEDKMLWLPIAAGETKYKGETKESTTIKYLDLNEVKIYGYTEHIMKPLKKETPKK